MGKGFWIGAILGLIVALVVSVTLVSTLQLEGIWAIIVGFLSGTIFTNVGIAIGTALDD